MPYIIQWEPNGVYKKFTGFVSAEEFFSSTQKFQGDPRFEEARYSINDFTAIDGHSMSHKDIKVIAGFSAGATLINSSVKVAIVTTSQTIIEFVNEFKEIGLKTFPVQIFPTLAMARKWAEPSE
jgi:hypothetical protein